LVRSVSGDELDALRLQLRAHRRVDIEIATGDPRPRCLGDRGDTALEGAAVTEDVDGHGVAGRAEDGRARCENSGMLAYFAACSCRGISARVAPAFMPKAIKAKQQQMRARIAAAAARLMAEDGLEDFALAKRKAARQLGAEDTQSLPKNEEIEAEL